MAKDSIALIYAQALLLARRDSDPLDFERYASMLLKLAMRDSGATA